MTTLLSFDENLLHSDEINKYQCAVKHISYWRPGYKRSIYRFYQISNNPLVSSSIRKRPTSCFTWLILFSLFSKFIFLIYYQWILQLANTSQFVFNLPKKWKIWIKLMVLQFLAINKDLRVLVFRNCAWNKYCKCTVISD